MLKQKLNKWAPVNTLGMLPRSLLSWISHWELAGLRPPRKVIDKPNLMPCPRAYCKLETQGRATRHSRDWGNLLGLCVGGVGGLPVSVSSPHPCWRSRGGDGVSISHQQLQPVSTDLIFMRITQSELEGCTPLSPFPAWRWKETHMEGNRRNTDLNPVLYWRDQPSWVQTSWEIKEHMFAPWSQTR